MSAPVTSLIASGLDAFSNLYDVRITIPGNLPTTTLEARSVRATNFSPPELTVGFYDVDYKIIQIKRPNSTIEGDRKFTIEFRMDAEYALYRDLLAWKNMFVDPTDEGSITFGALSGPLVSANYGTVEVVTYKASSNSEDISGTTGDTMIGAKWNFSNVICMKVGQPVFSREGTDPATISADFIFGEYTLDFPE